MNTQCMLCHGTSLRQMIEIKGMTIAHQLLDRANQSKDTFNIRHVVCQQCGLIQIANPIDPDVLYSSYNFNFSSWKKEPHFEHELDTIISHGLPGSAFEIGCNDGKFLEALQSRGVKNLFGVEPNPVSSSQAQSKSDLRIFNSMITPEIALEALAENGKFDLVLSRQVMEHVEDIDNFLECADLLLADDGLLFIDLPDFGPALALGDVSLLWEEHISNFTRPVLNELLVRKGFKPFDSYSYDFSGGTMSTLSRRSDKSETDTDKTWITEHLASTENYAAKVNRYGTRLRKALEKAADSGFLIILYGSGGRANVALTALGIGDLINFAIDDQSERQGKYLPCNSIEIRPTNVLQSSDQPMVILLAVNNDSEPTVIKQAQDLSRESMLFLSIFGPKDIHEELNAFESVLSAGTCIQI
jgi:2-polyprenyl-3-methyl-5-hydroxy-6-metoxy-1,4-benzoquinol methylase